MYSIADVDDDKVCDSEDRGASHEQGMLVILKFSVACLRLRVTVRPRTGIPHSE